MNLRPYSPGDWERLCAIHDAARVHELQASGLADAFLSLEQTAENEGLFDGEVVVAVLVDRQSRPAGVLADRCRDGADAGRHGTDAGHRHGETVGACAWSPRTPLPAGECARARIVRPRTFEIPARP